MREDLIPLGIWGGTYDMPTKRHKQFILDALEFVNILYVIPCGKQDSKQPIALPWDRVAMIGLVVAEILAENPEYEGRVRVWTGEIEDAKSENKTIETTEQIEALLDLVGKAIIFIGEDLVDGYPKWERAGERAVLVHEREGYEGSVLRPYMQRMGNERKNGSSSAVRERIKRGENFADFVPRSVAGLIRQRKLYGYKRGPRI